MGTLRLGRALPVFPWLLTPGACDRGDPAPGGQIVVVPAAASTRRSPAAPPTAPLPAPAASTSFNGADRIERGVSPPPADPEPGRVILRMTPRTFVDPPLPPELLDDGGLKPLPTPSARPGDAQR